MRLYHFAMISLATIGVCVFGAFTSVGALFYFAEINKVCMAFLGAVFIKLFRKIKMDGDKMTSKKMLCVIVGIILVVAGIIAIVYAQNEISSSWGYTWTQPYSDYEARIMTIKNVGTGSLVLGILDIVVIGLYKVLKKEG